MESIAEHTHHSRHINDFTVVIFLLELLN